MEKKAHALSCIEKGWVITPILPDTKRPRYKWKEAEGQIRAVDEAEYHWDEYPNDNIAIITGESGLFVVDVDSAKHTVDPQVLMEILEYPTYSVRTQSGGYHYYYSSEEALRDQLGAVKGIDIKCDGYVLAPGSTIEGREYLELENIPIAPMPSFSFVPKPKTLVDSGFLPTGYVVPSVHPVAKEDLISALAYIQPNDREIWIKVGMAIKDAGMSVDIWDDWSRPSSKYEAGECERVWASFKGSGVGVGSVFHLAKEGGYVYEGTHNIPTPPEGEEEEKTFTLPQTLASQATRDLSWLGDSTKDYPHYETGIKWFDEATRGLQQTTILTAPSNTGKTLLALQIAKSVSASERPVLYIDFEQGAQNLYSRMLTMGTQYDTEDLLVRGEELMRDPEFLAHYQCFNRESRNIHITHIGECESLGELEVYINAWRNSVIGDPLVIIDQIRGLSGVTGKDNLFEQTREIALWVQDVPRNNGWTTLAVAPQNKLSDNSSEINAISGSSDLGYSVDCVISLRKKLTEKPEQPGLSPRYKPKVQYEPWNKKDIVMEIPKSRTPRSVGSKELIITSTGLEPQSCTAETIEEIVDREFGMSDIY